MKILVTGGAGFIGSNFIEYALANEHTIINVDKLTYAGNLNNLSFCGGHKKYYFYRSDICDKKSISKIFEMHRPEIIIHMAAESHVDRSIDAPSDFIQTNIVGTHAFLEETLRYYKLSTDITPAFKFIHLSTDEVYGSLNQNEPTFCETSPYRPNSPYAASKASSDHLVRSFNRTYGLPTIIINTTNNYGPRQFPEKLIPLTILNALEEKPLPVYGNGQQVRDWIYVQDHVEAIFSILNKGKIGESYCIGANNEISNLEMVQMICTLLDELKPGLIKYNHLIKFVPDRPGHDVRYGLNIHKIKQQTGWFPRTVFQNGVTRTIEWYLNQFDLIKGERGARERRGLGQLI